MIFTILDSVRVVDCRCINHCRGVQSFPDNITYPYVMYTCQGISRNPAIVMCEYSSLPSIFHGVLLLFYG